MRFEAYLVESDVSYEQYVQGVESYFSVDEGLKELTDKAANFVKSKFKEASKEIDRIMLDTGLSIVNIAHAFLEKDVYRMMKAFGFSIKVILKSLHDLTGLVRKGLFDVFEKLHKTKLFQKIHAGTVKWDEIVEQYPILKKVTGPIVAALLFYIWTQMTFIGNIDYDFDFSSITSALKGNYSLADLFGSPHGVMLLSLFASGSLISVPWLGSTAYNLILAIVYTSVKRLHSVDHKIVKNIKSKLEFA